MQLSKIETEKALQKFTKYVVDESRENLIKNNRNVKRNLYNSIKGESTTSKNSISLSFSMEDYGEYQDLGVKGKTSDDRAPNSPFRFGSKKGKAGGLIEGIKEWVKNRRFQFRDIDLKTGKSTGRFLSYEQTAFLITRSIYHKGITATRFFSKPFEKGFERLPDELVEAYGLDVENFLKMSKLNGK